MTQQTDDPISASYKVYRFVKRLRDRRKKSKSRKRRKALEAEAERLRIDRAMGFYNTSHSPLASKRSFFVPKFSHNPLRSFIHG